MRLICFIFIAFLWTSCDPYYSLSFSAKNDSKQPVFIKFMNNPDSIIKLEPNMEQVFTVQHGVGFAKEKYRLGNYQNWFHDNSMTLKIISDSTVKKVHKAEWKYHGGYINGKGTYHIKV